MRSAEDRERMRRALGASMGIEEEEVTEERGKGVQKVKHLDARSYSNRTHGIKLNKNCVYVSQEVADLLGGAGAKVYLWTAEYDGQNVLLMRPANNSLTKSYKLSPFSKYGKAYRIGTAALVNRMIAAGLQLGGYYIRRTKGVVVAIPEGVQP